MAATLAESQKHYKENIAQKTLKSLKKNNISGYYFETLEETCEKIIGLIPLGSKIGHGGSLTLDQLGIKDILRNGNYDFIDRALPDIDEKKQDQLRKESLLADVFLMSTNALTTDGQLVNIDGTGNRMAALIFGPSKVIIVAGTNKIVSDTNAAIHRIKNYVAPIHAQIKGKKIPCATTGHCVNCHAPGRFCNALVIIEHQYILERITVIIVGQELGL
jgi:hypothetical protein